MRTSIFLDWFGVIADNNKMTRRWRTVEAEILQRKYGGSFKSWIYSHDKAYHWHLNYWSKHGTESSQSYRRLWKQCEIEWMKRTLKWAGIPPPKSERKLFEMDRELTREVTRRIDPAYPYSRRVLRKLNRLGYRLFLVSGADSDYISGALEATGLGGFFEEAYSPDELDAFKGSEQYWKKILRLSRSPSDSSIVVDDRPKHLRLPSIIGLGTILINNSSNNEFTTLKSIAGLPDLLEGLKKTKQRLRKSTNA